MFDESSLHTNRFVLRNSICILQGIIDFAFNLRKMYTSCVSSACHHHSFSQLAPLLSIEEVNIIYISKIILDILVHVVQVQKNAYEQTYLTVKFMIVLS